MLKWLIRRKIQQFERMFDYDAGYIRELLEIDSRAFFALARVTKLGAYREGVPRDAYFAARVVAALAEDCGPCTQLNVAMALREGVAPATLAAVIRGAAAALPEPVQLAVRFARAALAHAGEADELRDAIRARWGARAVVALAYALVTARLYPTLKYALGHGRACRRVVVDGAPVVVVRGAA